MQQKRFTIYDMLEARGEFRKNPANPGSVDDSGNPLYKGPLKYPKMLYHPKGEEEITSKGDVMTSPLGAQLVNVRKKLISKVVNTPEEEKVLRDAGWHDHPAKAIAASGREAPPISPSAVISQKDEEIKRLQEALAAMKADQKEVEKLKSEKAA